MKSSPNSFLKSCLATMLQPIVDFCVARGLHLQDFIGIAKRCFITSAERRLKSSNKEVTISRLSVMTGLQRPEVARLRTTQEELKSKDFVTRVVGQWNSDKRFCDKRGRPRPLTTGGQRSELAKLVAAVSQDLNPHTLRFELARLELISERDGKAQLVQPAYLTTADPTKTIQFGAEDARDLLSAIQENAFSLSEEPHLNARTQYDNVPDEALNSIRTWFLQLGQRVHQQCRTYLSKFDRDISGKKIAGDGRNRVVLGTFSFIEPVQDDSGESKEKEKL